MEETKVVRIFVGSPNDVKPEREILEEVVKELNDLWAATMGVYLELIKWETHAYPDIGTDPQSVINKQIGDDWDVFVGILWSRFGTPTPRAESGTAEEFERAYSRYQKDRDSVKVMFYFKDEPLPPSRLDPEQIIRINSFKTKLGELGGLHWRFESTEDFTKYLRMHLTRQIQHWKGRPTAKVMPSPNEGREVSISPVDKLVQEYVEEEGFLDVIESGIESFEMLAEVGNRMTERLNVLAEYTDNNAQEMQELAPLGGKEHIKKAKRLVNQMAEQLGAFTKRMEAEIPLYRKYFSTGIDCFGKAANLLTDFEGDPRETIEEASNTMATIRKTVVQTRKSMNFFSETIAGLPRATTHFNRAKRECVAFLTKFDKEMESGINLTNEVESMMMDLRDRDVNI